jgi:CheY-like chemotaxis protein
MKILLVDDSKSARYALRLQLQRHGVEVETADSAESAFEMLNSLLPDAIMMDHMMPGLNGFEALEVLRDNPRTAQIPVVMCTSHEESDFIATAKKKGVFGILPKSAAPELLPGILERLHEHMAGAPRPQPTAAQIRPSTDQHPATAAFSDEAMAQLVDARLEARLSKLLPPMLEEVRRNLTDKILSEAGKAIDERFAAEQASKRAGAPAPTMADLQAISTRLATETMPDLIKRSFEAERGRLLESLEKHLRDARPKPGAGAQHSDAHDEAIVIKASAMARRESQETIEAALSGTQEAIQSVEKSVQASMGKLYGLITVAAILGMGAAGLVFYLLRG